MLLFKKSTLNLPTSKSECIRGFLLPFYRKVEQESWNNNREKSLLFLVPRWNVLFPKNSLQKKRTQCNSFLLFKFWVWNGIRIIHYLLLCVFATTQCNGQCICMQSSNYVWKRKRKRKREPREMKATKWGERKGKSRQNDVCTELNRQASHNAQRHVNQRKQPLISLEK